MNRRRAARIGILCSVGIAALGIAWSAQQHEAKAADHTDPPNRVGTPGDAADIGDLYAWHTGNSTLVVVLTFGGPVAPAADQTGNFDPDVLYGIHLDNDGDAVADTDVWVRFAENDLGDWGVQVQNIPGESDTLVGPVATDLTTANGATVHAGLFDDPFFFDLQGFQETLMMGSLQFDSTRDFFAGLNITAVVLEVPLTAALSGGSTLDIWATSSRI